MGKGKGGGGGGSSSSLAPGFRFHPTDEELVAYYLRRKVSGKPFRVDAISEIEVYKTEPWDLAGLSKLKTRDLEWYFFSNLDKKYSNGSKTNRATCEGYWKTTGKDRPIRHRSRVLGMKKTLVFHRGRAPRGERTNYVMHEYRLADEELEKAGLLQQESFVLCRIFQKSGTGPKNGERYGAPFEDEEWEAEDVEDSNFPCEPAPVQVFIADDVFITDELLTAENEFDQNLTPDLSFEVPCPPLNLYQGDDISLIEDLAQNDLDPLPFFNEGQLDLETNDDKNFFNLPVQHELQAVKNEYAAPPTNGMDHTLLNNLPVEQCLDKVKVAPSDERYYLEANDLSEPYKEKSSSMQLLDEYLAYFDAENDISQYLTFDSPDPIDANGSFSDQTFLPDQILEQASTSNQQLPAPDTYQPDIASSSMQVTGALNTEPDADVNYPFMKEESKMLSSFPAPPTFASTFPTKDMAAKLYAHSSEPIRVTAGMIRIRDQSMNDSGIHWSLDKRGNVNVVLTFDLPESIIAGPYGFKAFTGIISQKMASVMSQDWAYLFFSLMLLFLGAKVGPCIYAR